MATLSQTFFRLSTTAAFACAIIVGGAWAEDPVPTALDTADAQPYIGAWTVTMDIGGRSIKMSLDIVDLDGKVGATLDSPQMPEPQALEDVSITEEGLVLLYEANFGGNTLKMRITAHEEAEGLAGSIAEQSGLFSATFTALPRVEGDTAEDFEQRERGRRPAPTQTKLTFGKDKMRILFANLKLDSKDHEALDKLEDGEVFSFVGGRATKLFTDADLTFADTVVKEGNAAPNYPGVYSLWLKKTPEGWRLVFNEESDVWGTQYNVDADAHEIGLTTAQVEESMDTFKVVLKETDDGGSITIAWGTTRWTADFTVATVEVASLTEE